MNMPIAERKSNQNKKGAVDLTRSHGKMKVLAVGVSEYTFGFKPLKQCKTDAKAVADAFRDIPQLNADQEQIVLMTASTVNKLPTRGHIITEIQTLASSAEQGDRILFYFSGHGCRLAGVDDHFLVPADVYSDVEKEAMISVKKIYEIMEGSPAKQKIVILDACLSGPSLLGPKNSAAQFSEKFFADQLSKTKGFVSLCSSSFDEPSYAKSQNPELSLFTYYLVKGLGGFEEALDKDKILTVPSLFDYVSAAVQRKAKSYHYTQTPSLYKNANGTMVVGDFRKSLIADASSTLQKEKIDYVSFCETDSVKVQDILPKRRDRTIDTERLTYAANTSSAMSEFLEEDFSRWRTKLRTKFNYLPKQIEVEGGTLEFPDGTLSFEFAAETKDSGKMKKMLELGENWFGDFERMQNLLSIFELNPDDITIGLTTQIKPIDQIQSLTANGWVVQSEKATKVVSKKGGVSLTVFQKRLSFKGINIDEFFSIAAAPSDDAQSFVQIINSLSAT